LLAGGDETAESKENLALLRSVMGLDPVPA